jgi:hypothetical protein
MIPTYDREPTDEELAVAYKTLKAIILTVTIVAVMVIAAVVYLIFQ